MQTRSVTPYKPTLFAMPWDCLRPLWKSLSLLSLCHCQGQRKSWNSTGLPVGHFVFCDTAKVVCHPTAKELSCKNRIKYIFTSPTRSGAVILVCCFLFFSSTPLLSIYSHFLRSPFAPFPPTLFYLLPNLVHGLIFWCNYPGNYSRAGLHLKAI